MSLYIGAWLSLDSARLYLDSAKLRRRVWFSDRFRRCLSAGPGLAVRVLCGEEPYMEKDFSETSVMVKIIVDYSNALNKVPPVSPAAFASCLVPKAFRGLLCSSGLTMH